MERFQELSSAIEEELTHCSLSSLREKVKALSLRYRKRSAVELGEMKDKEERLAYVGYRMQATLGAMAAVFDQLLLNLKKETIESVLDLGSGPATSLWCLPVLFPSVKKIVLLERDLELIHLGKRLFSRIQSPIDAEVLWHHGDFCRIDFPVSDLVLFSYSLNEIDENYDEVVLKKAFESAKKWVVIIEPGSKEGYRRLMKARKFLIELGAKTIAPCPHDRPCPLTAEDWCHFSTRVQRSAIHRFLKQGTLGFEDEKYSYIVMAKQGAARAVERVLAPPVVYKEKVVLKLCVSEGLKYQEVPKRNKEAYKKAKKLISGDNFI